MTRWRLFYHIIWTTDQNALSITPNIELKLHRAIAQTATGMKTSVLAINGMPDHVHVVVAIPPTVAPLHLVEMLKQGSAQAIQHEFGVTLEWQKGCGIVTVGKRSLQRTIEYVHNQKDAHQTLTTIPTLERTSDQDEGPDTDTDLDPPN